MVTHCDVRVTRLH